MIFDLFIRALPKKKLSYLTGRVVRVKRPRWLARFAANTFAKYYSLNMNEAEFPIESYQCLGDLFTRRLKEGVRPISDAPLVHCADAEITEKGLIAEGQLVQAKGSNYSIEQFLYDSHASEIFRGGLFMTYYLCPTDYHRVHFPFSGKVTAVTHIPGALWPVNPWSVRNIKDLFAINERVVVRMETEFGPAAVVLVGATNVGEMSLSFEPAVRSNRPGQIDVFHKSYEVPYEAKQAEELGIFHMGSTVILVLSKDFVDQMPALLDLPGGHVRMGEKLAQPQSWQ